MSALMLRWLNEELELHRRVAVLERDLSNGYIFAEVLHLQGLEPKLESYEDASATAVKIQNMELLGQRLEALGLPFPVSTRRAIMMEDRSAVLQFLLQLNDFLRPRPKAGAGSTKAQAATSSRSVTAQGHDEAVNAKFPPRDVDERFVMATAQKFHPTAVRFEKNVDMAVHLRKFEQMQWRAENEQHEAQEQAKTDKNATSAAGYAAARANLHEKAKFMRDWDHEHHKKWKHTQRLHLAAERDDLRLELTLAARRRLNAEAKLEKSQQDAATGVVEFEKNMNRLGLASGGNEQPLKAISATDAGAMAHWSSLEKRVEDLDFRPSNNVKMMKELRKRRKAQLAAEKDRRMRRQKALADQKKSIQERESHTVDSNLLPPGDDAGDPATATSGNSVEEALARDSYLAERRAELEANYERLRESGSAKRKEDWKTLAELRLEAQKKEQFRKWDVCSDAVEALISLTVAIATTSDQDVMTMQEQKTRLFLRLPPSNTKLRELGNQEQRYELTSCVDNFLSLSEVWASLPLQSQPDAYSPQSDLQALADWWLRPPAALDTSWPRPLAFTLASVFTEDDSTAELVQRISMEHQMVLVQLDRIADECVAKSYDPQKLGDQVATLTDRERELGAFGPKITSLRQKNTPLPEALAVEIVATAISLCRREASNAPAELSAIIRADTMGGCMLHNFPRTLDEAKLLEKAITPFVAEDGKESSSPPPQGQMPGESAEATASSTKSLWDCVVSISPKKPAEADATMQASDSTASLGEQRGSVAQLTAQATQQKLRADDEQARNDEQRALLRTHWGQTTRHLKIDQTDLHRDVLVETVHLWIDSSTQVPYDEITEEIECRSGLFPTQLVPQRDARRAKMGLADRAAWLKASQEIDVPDDAFAELVGQLRHMDETLCQNLREPLAAVRTALHRITAIGITTERELERRLDGGGAAAFQDRLDRATAKLRAARSSSPRCQRERILTELEVSLGDLAEASRAAGNNCVAALAQDPLPPVVAAVDAVYQTLPSICFLLKDHTMQKLELLRTQLFDRLPFLHESVSDAGRKVILPKTLTQEAIDAATGLGGGQTGGRERPQPARGEVLRMLGQIATDYAFQTMDEVSVEPYALHETRVTTVEITRLLQRLALLCRFADRLRERAGQLYARDVRRFGQVVQQELTSKNEAIATVMAAMRAQCHAMWPTGKSELVAVSGIAAHLPRTQSEQFLSVAQLGVLVQTFLDWELAEPITARGLGGGSIASDVFVALVLQVATKDAFPERWRDARAVAGVSLQQSSSRGFVSWRKFVWTLLCIQFVGLPALEAILEYQAQALKAIEAKGEDQSTFDGVDLTATQFRELPLWFERLAHTQPTRTEQDVETLKTLVFRLFATASLSSGIDAGAASTERVQLLPMLLCWCVHPSCSFGVRQELSEFLPRYPRGLLRAFHLLSNRSPAHQSEAMRVSALLAVAGVSAAADAQQQLVNCFVCDTAVDFPSFSNACSADLERFFVLQNPLEALVQP